MATSVSSVPAKFLAAIDAIREHEALRLKDSPFKVVQDWTEADQRSFFNWFSMQAEAEDEEEIRQEQAKPAMTVPQYIESLMNVDFSDEVGVGRFINVTQQSYPRPPPQPVVLGTENCYKYQLISCLEEEDISSDIPEGAEESGVVVEIRSTLPGTKSPVQYVVPLGFLQCVATHSHRTRTTPSSKPMETPFAIVLNIVDKSIWMVLGTYRRDVDELAVPIPANANSWDFLPEPANRHRSFDVMQILTWEDFISLGRTSTKARHFFSKAALATAVKIAPAYYAVTKSDVSKALGNHITVTPK